MKKGGLEIGVLLVGALVIVASLLVKFFFNLPANQTLIVSNIIFSVGFLIYILYSIMTTNALNKDIRGLNAHVAGLKKEIAAKNNEINQLKGTVKGLESDNNVLEKEATELRNELSGLQDELMALRAAAEKSDKKQ